MNKKKRNKRKEEKRKGLERSYQVRCWVQLNYASLRCYKRLEEYQPLLYVAQMSSHRLGCSQSSQELIICDDMHIRMM